MYIRGNLAENVAIHFHPTGPSVSFEMQIGGQCGLLKLIKIFIAHKYYEQFNVFLQTFNML